MEIILSKLPMPPTNNHRLMPSRGRLIKSPEFRDFDRRIEIWILRNMKRVHIIRENVAKWIADRNFIELEIDFCFPREKLISKKGDPKRIDCDGRIKTTIDYISNIIAQDDKWVTKIIAKKIFQQSSEEHVTIKLTPILWNTLKPIQEKNDGLQA